MIDITPEMIDAGLKALPGSGLISDKTIPERDAVESIIKAALAAHVDPKASWPKWKGSFPHGNFPG